jgi:FKBP-type peptidyl-prolyl cis-trans isomerase SlyD
MMDKDGNSITGMINEITETCVIMDFNHPMEGTDLWFLGKILDVRDATQREINSSLTGCSGCPDSNISNCPGCNQ